MTRSNEYIPGLSEWLRHHEYNYDVIGLEDEEPRDSRIYRKIPIETLSKFSINGDRRKK